MTMEGTDITISIFDDRLEIKKPADSCRALLRKT